MGLVPGPRSLEVYEGPPSLWVCTEAVQSVVPVLGVFSLRVLAVGCTVRVGWT